MSALDADYRRAQRGDHEGFADWVRRVEPALRARLRAFARAVDAESVLQEGLLRMWVLAPTLKLEGENASLRYAAVLATNLAIRESRRVGVFEPLDANGVDVPVAPATPPDRGVRDAILACLERLPGKPAKALLARLENRGDQADRALAAGLGMTLNTFLQNVVRARRRLADCLKARGVSVGEYLR